MSALAEAIRIGREAHLPVEVFHLKVAGKSRWGTMKNVVQEIQKARDSGIDIAADVYPCMASETSLSAYFPPWVADGGTGKLLERLKDPAIRARIKKELATDDWENIYFEAGGATGVLVLPASPELKKFDGKTLEDVANAWKKSPEDTLMDFVLTDNAHTEAIDFHGSEEDLKTGLTQLWTSIGQRDGARWMVHSTPPTPIPAGLVPCHVFSAIIAISISFRSRPPSARSLPCPRNASILHSACFFNTEHR
jgi:N-acyl-D-amino-acid deacylase